MTICACFNGTLYSDRAGLGMSRPAIFVDMGKLYIAPKKNFAMAVSGTPFQNTSYFKKNMEIVGKKLKLLDALTGKLDLDPAMIEFFEDRQILLMTRKNGYLVSYSQSELNSREIVRLDKDLPAFIGSGYKYAAIAMLAGKTVKEAMRISSIVDTASYITEIDSVTQKDLLPF